MALSGAVVDPADRRPVVDLTDEEARRALPLKWGVPDGVIPAWVAEMDYAVDPVVIGAVQRALADGVTGYPVIEGDGLGEAYAAWAERQIGWAPDPDAVLPVADVTAGVRLAVEVLSGPGGVVFPVPGYNAHHRLADVTGREERLLEVPADADRAEVDLDRLDRLFADGAQTLILCQPHNPLGRVFTRPELEGIRDVVVRHGARVVSDEIHAPLVLPGAQHVSYLSIDGTHDHAVAVVGASKAFNTAGLKCAQLVVPDGAARGRIEEQPMSVTSVCSPLGIVAARAAYEHGDGWLASLVERLDQQRALLADLLATHLPEVRMRPLEATYLAWLDASSYGHADAAAVALDRGGVRLAPGASYAPGSVGCVRLNIATSPSRLTSIVERLAQAWTEAP